MDLALHRVLDAETVWFSEFDPAPSKILAHHWPDVPNHGDITKIDWSTVEPVDILTGGFPCQDVSLAGRRAGITEGTRSGLWSEFARAIDVLRPGLVVIENVRGLLSATADGAMEPDPWGVGDGATRPVVNALGVVLGDLASMGYDTVRGGFRASDAGAPHGRYRVFIVAQDANLPARDEWRQPAPEQAESGRPRTDAGGRGGTLIANADSGERNGRERATGRVALRGTAVAGSRDEFAANARGERFWEHPGATFAEEAGAAGGDFVDGPGGSWPDIDWGPYAPAITRWESISGRIAPAPTLPDGAKGNHRLSAPFVEWMMGLPEGHVTASEIGLTRNEQLKALGNGVVPQQVELAVRHLLGMIP